MRTYAYLRSTVKDRARQRGFNSTADMVGAAATTISDTTDPLWANVVCLVRGRGANATTPTDDKGKTFTANNGARISTRVSDDVFPGGGLMAVNSELTGSRFSTPNSSDFNFPGDFCIEAMVMPGGFTNTQRAILSTYQGVSNGWGLYTTSQKFSANLTGDGVDLQDNVTWTPFEWYHVAVTRSGSTNRLYVNGTQKASLTDSTSLTSTSIFSIGNIAAVANQPWVGYIKNVRITKGAARYTSDFTPSFADFPTA